MRTDDREPSSSEPTKNRLANSTITGPDGSPGDITTEGLSAHTHEFSEWAKYFEPDTSRLIPWADALCDQGSGEKVAAIEKRVAEQEMIDSIFALPTDDTIETWA